MSDNATQVERRGALFAVLAYGAWGFLPAYWKMLSEVPVTNLLSVRILGSAVCGVALVVTLGRSNELRDISRNPAVLRRLGLTSLLLAGNWLLYLWSVLEGRIVEASLGYYITPLFNVGWGIWGDKERLLPYQWFAFGIAAVGVSLMAVDLGTLPWVSLILAASFSTYGFVRKRANVSALGGQTGESLLLCLPAGVTLLAFGAGDAAGAFGGAETTTLGLALLILAGPVTIAPLIWFAAAAKSLPYSKLGLFQYIAPSLQLLLAVAVYHERFGVVRGATFTLIGIALSIYVLGSLRRRRGVEPTRPALPRRITR